MKDMFRILAITLLALGVSVMPLRGLANMAAMDCCPDMGGAKMHHIQTAETMSDTDQTNNSGCPDQQECQSGLCLTASSCSTSVLGLTTNNTFSFKPATLNPYDLLENLYTSHSTPPLLKPPCILPV